VYFSVLYLIVVPLPRDKNPFAFKCNNNSIVLLLIIITIWPSYVFPHFTESRWERLPATYTSLPCSTGLQTERQTALRAESFTPFSQLIGLYIAVRVTRGEGLLDDV
jgi:hypothetical protein